MTKRNERTSPATLKVAAKYMPMTFDEFCDRLLTVGKARRVFGDIKTLSGSCLTQAEDRVRGRPTTGCGAPPNPPNKNSGAHKPKRAATKQRAS